MSKLGILGGGIGGSCLARALKQHGFTSNHKYSVRLIEQEPFRVNTFGGGITLTPNALRGLDSLGLYSKVRKYSVPLKNIFTYNDKGKLLRKHNYEFVENHYGYPILLMDRTYLNMVLVEDIPQQWWKLGSTVSAVEQDAKGVVAIFDDGNYEDFDALVGCDGVDSVVAEYIRRETNQRPKPENEKPNNEDEPEEDELEDDYELELGSTTVLGVSEPLNNPSIAPGDIHWVFGENLVYGAYALKDNRVVWFTTQIDEEPEPFWSPETAENIKSIQESNWWFPDSQSFSKTEFFEKTEKAIKVGTMKLATELKIWSKDRITLLGDAAHHSFPYIGYGPNTAIEDAIVLSNLIMKNPKTLDVAFKEYESKRVQRCNKLSELAADSVDLHTNEEAKETWWRDTLMRLLPDFMYNRELQWIYGYQPIIANLAKDEPELAVIPASLPASSRKDAIGKWVEIPDAPTPELQPEEVPTQAANPKEMKPSISATITANSNTKKQATQYTKHRRVKVY